MRWAIAAATVLLGSSVVAAQPAPALTELLGRLSAYLTEYEPQLAAIVADEALTQSAADPARTSTGGPLRRELRSEVSFSELPGGGAWLGFRDVRTVDGIPVDGGRARLQALLAGDADQQAQAVALARESARFNLGGARTINTPTMPLELLLPRNRDRFRFHRRGRSRGPEGERVRAIDFEETGRPSIIRGPDDEDIVARGTVWLEEGTGRVWRVSVRLIAYLAGHGRAEASTLEVTFGQEPELGLLVPVRLRETFPLGTGRGAGDARYSNYRRFRTAARIVPP